MQSRKAVMCNLNAAECERDVGRMPSPQCGNAGMAADSFGAGGGLPGPDFTLATHLTAIPAVANLLVWIRLIVELDWLVVKKCKSGLGNHIPLKWFVFRFGRGTVPLLCVKLRLTFGWGVEESNSKGGIQKKTKLLMDPIGVCVPTVVRRSEFPGLFGHRGQLLARAMRLLLWNVEVIYACENITFYMLPSTPAMGVVDIWYWSRA